jgi:hypothetical protein
MESLEEQEQYTRLDAEVAQEEAGMSHHRGKILEAHWRTPGGTANTEQGKERANRTVNCTLIRAVSKVPVHSSVAGSDLVMVL